MEKFSRKGAELAEDAKEEEKKKPRALALKFSFVREAS